MTQSKDPSGVIEWQNSETINARFTALEVRMFEAERALAYLAQAHESIDPTPPVEAE